MINPTQQHVPQFVQRNLFLAALLGLHATGRRIESWISSQAAQGAARRGPRLPKDSTFLAFLLGAVSVNRAVDRSFGVFLEDAPPPPPPLEPSEPPCLRSLLK